MGRHHDEIRKEVRGILSPKFYRIFLQADIESLSSSDTEGLYAAADRNEIKDLIGCSKCNPYETPVDAEVVINKGRGSILEKSKRKLSGYVNRFIFAI